MNTLSRNITSNQTGTHPDLEIIVNKHIQHDFQKPVSEFSQKAFTEAEKYYLENPDNCILDSGCGTGESTFNIANRFPQCTVIGVDQSEDRINRNNDWELPQNAVLIRADLVDFWRLAVLSKWKFKKHFLWYPNPWPKKKHLQRRWHGHPVFPILKKLGGHLELRTNWKIYAEEFSLAITVLSDTKTGVEIWDPDIPETPFERKYQSSGQQLYRLTITLD